MTETFVITRDDDGNVVCGIALKFRSKPASFNYHTLDDPKTYHGKSLRAKVMEALKRELEVDIESVVIRFNKQDYSFSIKAVTNDQDGQDDDQGSFSGTLYPVTFH
ncbi:MAG: hypothetical protein IM631_12540 [Cytophagales bacterium]|nr:hypothetical protein [Cytophagales bacterium]MCA6382343.1 hypothetical protein [Cytophagales bacterium]